MNSLREKITPEEIVNPKDIPLIRNIECPIDNMVPLEDYAVVCKKCETIFCKDCIDIWKKSSRVCPMRCSPMELIKVEHTIIGQQLQKIRLKCNNDIYGCEAKILVKDYKKHENECPYKQEECGSCKEKKCSFLLADHLLTECEVLKIKCFVCSAKCQLGEVKAHINDCLEKSDYCEICNSYHNNITDQNNINDINLKYNCRLQILNCSKCNLPELNYLIGTPEHICLNDKAKSLPNSLNNYLLQLSVRISVSMEKALKDRVKLNEEFLKDFKEKIKCIQKIYFYKLYTITNKHKKIYEDYNRKIISRSNETKESIIKLKEENVIYTTKLESKC